MWSDQEFLNFNPDPDFLVLDPDPDFLVLDPDPDFLVLNPSKSPDVRSATSGWLNLWISFLQFWVNLALKVESRLSQFGPGRNLQILPFYFCPFSPSHHLFLCPALILNSLVRFLFLILHSLSPIFPCPFLCPFWPCLFHVCKCTICQSS